MQLYIGAKSTTKIPGEQMLLKPFERVSKPILGRPYCAVCINDSAGEVRFVLEFANRDEYESFCTRIENANFHDSLVIDHEEENDDGDVETWEELTEHPNFWAVYVQGPRKTVRTKAPPATE
jgi:hypothetical protein